MQLSKKTFSPLSGNDSLDPKETKRDDQPGNSENPLSESDGETPGESENESFKTSLRDALQDWSNDDARDIEEDDSTP